nr:hypothetical protein [Azospirillum sp. INR13]
MIGERIADSARARGHQPDPIEQVLQVTVRVPVAKSLVERRGGKAERRHDQHVSSENTDDVEEHDGRKLIGVPQENRWWFVDLSRKLYRIHVPIPLHVWRIYARFRRGFAVLVGHQIAQAQTPELPVAPLSEIEAAYDSSKAAAPASELDTLQKAIQEEIDARGGKPNVTLPSQASKGAAPATPVATTPPRSASPTTPATTQAVVRSGTAAAPKV